MRLNSHTLYKFIGIYVGLFPLLPFNLKASIIYLIVLLGFLNKEYFYNIKKNWLKIFCISVVFITYLTSLIFTQNLKQGLVEIIRLLPLILLPVSIININNSVFKTYLIKTFIFSSLFLVLVIFYLLCTSGYLEQEISLDSFYDYLSFSFYLKETPLYLSLYISLAILLSCIYYDTYISIFILFILFLGLIILSRRANIILTPLFSIFIITLKNRRKGILSLSIIAFSIFVTFLCFPDFLFRFKELANPTTMKFNPYSSSGIHMTLWENSLVLIKDSNYMGYGIGDTDEVLTLRMKELGNEYLAQSQFNCHNQYLQIGLTFGFLGVLLFLLTVMYLLIQSIRANNSNFAVLFLFFLSLFILESYLERQNGIIIYSLFLSLFLFENQYEIQTINYWTFSKTLFRSKYRK